MRGLTLLHEILTRLLDLYGEALEETLIYPDDPRGLIICPVVHMGVDQALRVLEQFDDWWLVETIPDKLRAEITVLPKAKG